MGPLSAMGRARLLPGDEEDAMDQENKKGAAFLTGGVAGSLLGMGVGLAVAPRPVAAKELPPAELPPGAVTLVLSDEAMSLLRSIDASARDIPAKMESLRSMVDSYFRGIAEQIAAIAEQLGARPARTYRLDSIKKLETTMTPKTPVDIHVATKENGVLLWLLLSFNSSDVTINIRFDELDWTIQLSNFVSARVSTPHFPGIWLVRADPDTPHYALLYSAGEFNGLEYKKTLRISALYTGTDTATLNYADGVKKIFMET